MPYELHETTTEVLCCMRTANEKPLHRGLFRFYIAMQLFHGPYGQGSATIVSICSQYLTITRVRCRFIQVARFVLSQQSLGTLRI